VSFHPISEIFPLIEGAEFEALVADIKANGLLEPIWLHPDGRIIDGRNRYRACQECGIEPAYRTWGGDGSLVSFVVSLNLRRRHLTASQRAALAVDLEPHYAAEARERQLATLKRGAEQQPVSPKMDERDAGKAAEKAGKAVGVGRQYVADAKKLSLERPELFEEVRSGEKTLTAARREASRAAISEATQFPSGKYRVLYADPPWKYGDNLTEDYGAAKWHYPSMSISELCDLPVRDTAHDDAVLFFVGHGAVAERLLQGHRSLGLRIQNLLYLGQGKAQYGAL
jgi:hypothetical protein